MGVGGSFDVVAGRVRRAPRWMQRVGLEWFFRFPQELRRMWKRYLVTNTLFIYYDDVARTKLDEWIYFLKNEEIKDTFTAQGLKEARQRLDLLKLPVAERRAYERYADELHYQASMVESSYTVPYQDGQADMVRTMIARGATMDEIVRLTGLTIAEIHELKLRPPSVRSHPPLTVPGSGRKWGKKFDIPLIRENPPPVFLPGNLRPFASSADGHSWFSSTINGIRSTRFRGKISVKNC